MASAVYNRGKMILLTNGVGRGSLPTKWKMALVTSSYTPNVDHDTWADVSANEIATGNGYSAGGVDVEASSTGFTAESADDTNDRGEITIKDVVYTASGGQIPSSGSGARYAILMEYNATQSTGRLIAYFDLAADKSSDVSITLSGFKLRGT